MVKNKKHILAVIPARGGSKGIKGKNIKRFCGKPLISYTITTAQQSKLFDHIIVSTDSAEIAKVAKKYGAEVPFLRPTKLAQDTSNIVDAIIHLLDFLASSNGYRPDILFLLQPTSPLREVHDLLDSYKLFQKNKAPALVSVCKTHHQVLNIINDRLEVVNPGSVHINRQELRDTYRQDGSMIYIVNVKEFLKNKTFMPKGETAAYVIEKWKGIDIDDPVDFLMAEVMFKNKKHFSKKL